MICAELARGGDAESANRRLSVSEMWKREGEEAARLGTKLHLHCEYDLNSEPLPRDAEILDEIAQFEEFKASKFYKDHGFRPYRTELCVAWISAGRSVSAGQIDALYIDKDDKFHITDFKRVKSKHKLDPNEGGFCLPGEQPACALPPMAHLLDTYLYFQKY